MKKVNGLEGDALLLVGIGVGGYLLWQYFFPSVSQEDQDTVTNMSTTPDAQNPFSPNFQYSLYAQNPNTYGQSWWLNLSQMSANLLFQGTNPANVNGVYNYITWGETIRSAFGFFGINFQVIQSVFQAVRSQADVANIATYLYFGHSINLYNLLSLGQGANFYLGNGLSPTQMAQIINEVMALPASN